MLLCAVCSGVFEIHTVKPVCIVAETQLLTGKQRVIHLRQVHVIPQSIAVRGQGFRSQFVVPTQRQWIDRNGRHSENNSVWRRVALAIVVEEEKRFVLLNRTTNVSTKLVKVIRSLPATTTIVVPGIRIH